MSLPLMPGSEPVQVQKAPEPELTPSGAAYFGNSLGVLEGCGCEACQRERARLQEVARPVPPPPELRRSPS